MKPITPHAYKTFQFIEAYIAQFGYPPSLAEVASALGLAKSNAAKRLDSLQRAGWITRQKYKQRTIRPVYPKAGAR